MSDRSQHNLDDELLSAYLDDELPPQEREMVEARLAADPAARQMLDELRHVAQAVRGLPRQKVGGDLRGSILQRTETAQQATPPVAQDLSNGAPARSGYSLPKITIGRTGRGWAWASLAVAAALLIMIFQSDRERKPILPPAAQRTNELAADKEIRSLDGSEVAAWKAPAAPAGEPALAHPADAAGLAASGPTENGHAVNGIAGYDSPGIVTAAPQSYATSSELRGESENAPARESMPPIDERDLVVVHVLAKRGALENKSFDQLLAGCGIVVEPEEPVEEKQLADRNRRREIASRGARAAGRLDAQTAERSGEEETDVDMVLVEAQPNAIMSCLDGLNKDVDNYLVVDVDEPPAADDAVSLQKAPTKKLASDLSKFSRGAVPQQQKDAFRGGKAYYYDTRSDRFGGGLGGASDAKQQAAQLLTRSSQSNANQGRAQRVLTPAKELDRGSELSDRGGPYSRNVDEVRRQFNLKMTADADRDNLQVLFVLSPSDAPAATPAAENRAE